MIRALCALILVVVACNWPSRPLAEEIVGEWEVLCRIDKESTASCPGKENLGMYKIFGPGGKVVAGAREGISMEGSWTLAGDELEVVFAGGDIRLTESYRARVEDGRLVLWHAERGFGAVHGRVGAPFVPAASKQSTPGSTAHALGGVDYTLALPADYRLTRDDNGRQEWSPSRSEGFTVQLSLSRRAQTQVDGQWVTPPCNDYDYGGVSSSSEVIDGVQRETSIGRSLCLEGSDRALFCSTGHTRGYLEKSEQDEALALCNSLAVAR